MTSMILFPYNYRGICKEDRDVTGGLLQQVIIFLIMILLLVGFIYSLLNKSSYFSFMDDTHKRAIISGASMIICCVSAYLVFIYHL